jgi:hypothetical protein
MISPSSFRSNGSLAQSVEQQAFNLLVLRSNRRRPIKFFFATSLLSSFLYSPLAPIFCCFAAFKQAYSPYSAALHTGYYDPYSAALHTGYYDPVFRFAAYGLL